MSLANVLLGFLFIVLLGRRFGLGAETDAYFIALSIIVYFEIIVSLSWVSIKHYYAELRIELETPLDWTLSALYTAIFGLSFVVIVIYYFGLRNTELLSLQTFQMLDILILLVLLRSLIKFQKKILNLEHVYWSVYVADAFVITVNLIMMQLFDLQNIKYIAYITVFSSVVLAALQFYGVRRITGFKYHFLKYNKNIIKSMFWASFKLNISSLLYSTKDLIIISILGSASAGTYSTYSIASKFVGAVTTVVTNPIENVYSARVSELMAHKKFNDAKHLMKKTLRTAAVVLFSACIATYLLLPIIVQFAFSDSVSKENIQSMIFLFALLSIYQVLKSVELPIKKVLNVLKYFNYGILINIIYAITVVLSYIVILQFHLPYWIIFTGIIIGQIVKISCSAVKFHKAMSHVLFINKA